MGPVSHQIPVFTIISSYLLYGTRIKCLIFTEYLHASLIIISLLYIKFQRRIFRKVKELIFYVSTNNKSFFPHRELTHYCLPALLQSIFFPLPKAELQVDIRGACFPTRVSGRVVVSLDQRGVETLIVVIPGQEPFMELLLQGAPRYTSTCCPLCPRCGLLARLEAGAGPGV